MNIWNEMLGNQVLVSAVLGWTVAQVLKTIIDSMQANNIERIMGIINGTTNYMMTEMTEKGVDFDDVLKDAQLKGYAEKDPTADIEGFDACRKICILASLAFGKHVFPEQVATEGITKLTPADVKKLRGVVEWLRFDFEARMRAAYASDPLGCFVDC